MPYVELVDEDRPGVKDEAFLAMGAYLQANPNPQGYRLPPGYYIEINRVLSADGIRDFVGTTLVIIYEKNGKPWGTFRFVDGEIEPGDGLSTDSFEQLH